MPSRLFARRSTEAAAEELFDPASVHKLVSLARASVTHPMQLQLKLASQTSPAQFVAFPDGSDGHLLIPFVGPDRASSARQMQRNMALVQANEDLALVTRDLAQGAALAKALIRNLQELTRNRKQLLLLLLGDLHLCLEDAMQDIGVLQDGEQDTSSAAPVSIGERIAIGSQIASALACMELLRVAVGIDLPDSREEP